MSIALPIQQNQVRQTNRPLATTQEIIKQLIASVLQSLNQTIDSDKLPTLEELKVIISDKKNALTPPANEINSTQYEYLHQVNTLDTLLERINEFDTFIKQNSVNTSHLSPKQVIQLIQIKNDICNQVIPQIHLTPYEQSGKDASLSQVAQPITPTINFLPQINTPNNILPPKEIEIAQLTLTNLATIGVRHQKHPLTPLRSTGYWIEKGKPLTVTLDYTEPGPNPLPEVWIHTIDDTTTFYEKAQKVPLVKGENTLIPEKNGIIYIAIYHPPLSGTETVTLAGEIHPMPHFVLGQHTNDDWKKMLEHYADDTPYVELVSNRAMVTVTREKGGQHIKDPEALLTKLETITQASENLWGIDTDKPYPHETKQDYYHFVESKDQGLAGNATNYRTSYPSKYIQELLDDKQLMNDGDSTVSHEIGHMLEPRDLITFDITDKHGVIADLTAFYLAREILGQNDIFSKIQEKRDNDVIQGWKPMPGWSEARTYLNNQTPNWDTLETYNSIKPFPFYQLLLTFGKAFYQRLGTLLRSLPYSQAKSDQQSITEQRQTRLITACSRAAGYDLIPFFEKWRFFDIPQQAKDTIHALKEKGELKVLDPNQPIWENTDETETVQFTYPLSTAPVPLLPEEENYLKQQNAMRPAREALASLLEQNLRKKLENIQKAQRKILNLSIDHRKFFTFEAFAKALQEKMQSLPPNTTLPQQWRDLSQSIYIKRPNKILSSAEASIYHDIYSAKTLDELTTTGETTVEKDIQAMLQPSEDFLTLVEELASIPFNTTDQQSPLETAKANTSNTIYTKLIAQRKALEDAEKLMLGLRVGTRRFFTLEQLKAKIDQKKRWSSAYANHAMLNNLSAHLNQLLEAKKKWEIGSERLFTQINQEQQMANLDNIEQRATNRLQSYQDLRQQSAQWSINGSTDRTLQSMLADDDREDMLQNIKRGYDNFLNEYFYQGNEQIKHVKKHLLSMTIDGEQFPNIDEFNAALDKKIASMAANDPHAKKIKALSESIYTGFLNRDSTILESTVFLPAITTQLADRLTTLDDEERIKDIEWQIDRLDLEPIQKQNLQFVLALNDILKQLQDPILLSALNTPQESEATLQQVENA